MPSIHFSDSSVEKAWCCLFSDASIFWKKRKIWPCNWHLYHKVYHKSTTL